jgi:hypothetical protein
MGASAMEKVKKIPIGVAPEDKVQRLRIYAQFDMNNNGYLSLAEIDKGIRDVLELPELFDAKPVIIRAYTAARTKIASKHSYGDDYVSKAEFRYLLIYLRMYYHLWIEFDILDSSNDRRLGEAEFVAGKERLAAWGISVKNPSEKFHELCKEYKENTHLTFTDFCDWACKRHLTKHVNCDSHDELD